MIKRQSTSSSIISNILYVLILTGAASCGISQVWLQSWYENCPVHHTNLSVENAEVVWTTATGPAVYCSLTFLPPANFSNFLVIVQSLGNCSSPFIFHSFDNKRSFNLCSLNSKLSKHLPTNLFSALLSAPLTLQGAIIKSSTTPENWTINKFQLTAVLTGLKRCPNSTLMCSSSSSCFPRSAICDGIQHCSDPSDEIDCGGIEEESFLNSKGRIVPLSLALMMLSILGLSIGVAVYQKVNTKRRRPSKYEFGYQVAQSIPDQQFGFEAAGDGMEGLELE